MENFTRQQISNYYFYNKKGEIVMVLEDIYKEETYFDHSNGITIQIDTCVFPENLEIFDAKLIRDICLVEVGLKLKNVDTGENKTLHTYYEDIKIDYMHKGVKCDGELQCISMIISNTMWGKIKLRIKKLFS